MFRNLIRSGKTAFATGLLDKMGYTTKDFYEFIKEKGYDYTNKRNWIMKGMMSQPAMNALLDLRQIQDEKTNRLK